MNILHHKSWHVRNRNNIERVKRDEKKARDEELEVERRIALAESERRVDELRQRLPKSESQKNVVEEVTEDDTNDLRRRHLDIFEDFDDKVRTTNRDHEKEVKEEKEKFETKTGILQYLVDRELLSDNNWYLDSHEKRMKLTDTGSAGTDSEKQLKDNKWKKLNDPIEDMKKYLNQMKPKTEEKTSRKCIQFVKSSESLHKIKSKKHKKHKKHKNKKRKRVSSESSDESEDNRVVDKKVAKSLEQLRAERLERERVEKERTRVLLTGKPQTSSETVVMDDRLRTYNSQFNPQIARQNIDK